MKFYPYKNGEGAKCFSHAEGVVRKVSTLLKGVCKKCYPVLRRGAKSFRPQVFPFCRPPLPIINDQSLIELTE